MSKVLFVTVLLAGLLLLVNSASATCPISVGSAIAQYLQIRTPLDGILSDMFEIRSLVKDCGNLSELESKYTNAQSRLESKYQDSRQSINNAYQSNKSTITSLVPSGSVRNWCLNTLENNYNNSLRNLTQKYETKKQNLQQKYESEKQKILQCESGF